MKIVNYRNGFKSILKIHHNKVKYHLGVKSSQISEKKNIYLSKSHYIILKYKVKENGFIFALKEHSS